MNELNASSQILASKDRKVHAPTPISKQKRIKCNVRAFGVDPFFFISKFSASLTLVLCQYQRQCSLNGPHSKYRMGHGLGSQCFMPVPAMQQTYACNAISFLLLFLCLHFTTLGCLVKLLMVNAGFNLSI